MRLSVNLDKLEEFLNRRRNPNRVNLWVFPYKLASQTSKFSLAETVFLSLRFPLFWTALVGGIHVAIVVGVGLYFHFHDHFTLRQIVAVYRLVPHQITDEFYAPLIVFPIMFVFSLLLSLVSRWAWNRRADRLNRISALPQAAPVALPSVWPPPPNRN